MEDCELRENTDQSVSLYELLRNDIEGKDVVRRDSDYTNDWVFV
jgi:hypothetical protein